jgi:uncharacterized protein
MTTPTPRPVALVTGASSGIGKSLLPLFAAGGYDLVLVARRGDRLAQQKAELEERHGNRVFPIELDLAAPGAAAALLARIDELSLEVDVLVNNAGFSLYGEFADQPLPPLQEMIALNVATLTELTHHFLRRMKARGSGKILQVASTGAFQPGPRMAVYYATKAYVLSFSEAVSAEIAGSGVTITVFCPGPTRTEFAEVARYEATPLAEWSMMTSEEVARVGYRALMRGERLAIAGTRNKLAAVVSQLSPRAMVLAVTDRLLRSRS